MNDLNKWNHLNKLAGELFFDTLKHNNLAYELVSLEVDENGFSIEFKTNKNISEGQLSLIEGKVKKVYSNHKLEDGKTSSNINFLKILGIGGVDNKKDDSIINRIFGFVSSSKEDFENKVFEIEERHSRDHRKIGHNLNLFYIDEEIGKGLPVWLPNGLILKNTIKKYVSNQLLKNDYLEIETPAVSNSNLFVTSGHLPYYKENMFPEMHNQEKENLYLRPMACPFHILFYKRTQKSYHDLPYRIAENARLYRYEYSGSLIGLERVRSMELTDAHIFVTPEQIESEIKHIFDLITITLKRFDIKIEYLELALRDKANTEKYHGEDSIWEQSESILRDFLQKNKIPHKELKGEAAFYGPKIDIQIRTSLGHLVTISTIQLDFLLPNKFKTTYIDSNGQKQVPILIHRGLIGTYERFIAILLEQTKGNLPFWLSPEQIVIIPIKNELHLEYAQTINEFLREHKFRSKVDSRNHRIASKIREAQLAKIKLQIIIGDEEINNKTISFRFSGEENTQSFSLEKFLELLIKLRKE